jgi:SAM-dependent methyltransferase
MDTDTVTIRDEVRDRYAAAARQVTAGRTGCCGAEADCCGPTAEAAPSPESGFYSETERAELPQLALAASLGCGNPLAVAELREGETVLDLGSGGGGDVLLSARRVGPTGRAYGLDMTDEMLELARRNAAEAGVSNVEFRKGHIEEIPLPDASVDVVISNCVINLSTDKPAVFAQIRRVLRPGGRVGVADIVADDSLTADQRAASGDWASCAAGALSRSEYVAALTEAGFTGVEVTYLNRAPNGMHSAIVRAVRP